MTRIALILAGQLPSLALAGATACGPNAPSAPVPPDATFRGQAVVGLGGYQDHVMEPFLSRDGRWLLFNNRNDPASATDIHLASAVTPDSFQYVGPLQGVNAVGVLDGVPSMDATGRVYWVSVRSYDQTLATLYQGRFSNGVVTGSTLVAGTIVRAQRGWLVMDAEVAADGATVIYADARFDGGSVPAESKLALGLVAGDRIDRDARSDEIFREVNASAPLVYAPATSANGLELFYTGLTPPSGTELFMASRPDRSAPFSNVRRIAAATGLVEGPTLSPDGRSLYYHRLDGGRFRLYRVTR